MPGLSEAAARNRKIAEGGLLSLFELLAVLLTVSATFAWLNHKLLRLPENIGLLITGLGASLILVVGGLLFPGAQLFDALKQTIKNIDFYDAVMNGMVAFLLFAGAMNVDLEKLKDRALGVGVLATFGVVASMLIVAVGMWLLTGAFGANLPFAWALVFGALIAPTDPIAVISTLKTLDIPDRLRVDMSGEALFNDGIAVVLFLIALQFALAGADEVGPLEAVELLVLEAGGGAVLGLITGYIAYRAMRAIDNFSVEVMISLALVMATYALANKLHMSGPIAVVVAGVLTGNRGAADAMSDTTRRYVFGFWTLIDDILNALLFLLIGLEVLVLGFDPRLGAIALVAVPLVLLARFVSVGAPVLLLDRWADFARGTVPVLTWGGVRGGISVALALSLPLAPERSLVLAATYNVVLFTLIVQGLSLGYVVRRTALRSGGEPERN